MNESIQHNKNAMINKSLTIHSTCTKQLLLTRPTILMNLFQCDILLGELCRHVVDHAILSPGTHTKRDIITT